MVPLGPFPECSAKEFCNPPIFYLHQSEQSILQLSAGAGSLTRKALYRYWNIHIILSLCPPVQTSVWDAGACDALWVCLPPPYLEGPRDQLKILENG